MPRLQSRSSGHGDQRVTPLLHDFRDKPGIIEAEILEEAGRILMRKACEKHGPFEDVLSESSRFLSKDGEPCFR